MGINWRQFELGILRPALEGEPEVAIKLVGETIFHESDRLRALGQYPNPADDMGQRAVEVFGPGLGIASIEEATWDWMVGKADSGRWNHTIFEELSSRMYQELAWDLKLNVLACRFRYKVDKRPLPENNMVSRSIYWMAVYNGSGVEDRRLGYVRNAVDIEWVK